MMHDGLAPRGGDDARPRSRPVDAPSPAPADREVPLPPGAELAALHAWLDGEVDDMAVTTAAAARQRAVWRRINEDAMRLRRASAPPFFDQKVMQALAAVATPAAAPVRAAAPQARSAFGPPTATDQPLPWMTIAAVAVGGALVGGLAAWLAR